MPGIHKIVKIFTQTKLDGEEVGIEEDPLKILRKAEQGDILYRYGRDTHFCIYKTKIKNQDAIMLLFAITLSNTVESSTSSETVMEIINLLEKLLMPINDYQYITNIGGVDKNVAILRVTKLISEDDIL